VAGDGEGGKTEKEDEKTVTQNSKRVTSPEKTKGQRFETDKKTTKREGTGSAKRSEDKKNLLRV